MRLPILFAALLRSPTSRFTSASKAHFSDFVVKTSAKDFKASKLQI
jgi:hypothetical protein